MFKRKNKKVGSQIPPQYNSPPMPSVKPPKPPTSGSNAVKPNLNYIPPTTVKEICTYKTPCGWCTKWDKKCDRKLGAMILRDQDLDGKGLSDMKEFHAYKNEDGTYKLEVICEFYKEDELKEAHMVYPKVSIVSDSLVIKACGDLFTVVLEESQ